MRQRPATGRPTGDDDELLKAEVEGQGLRVSGSGTDMAKRNAQEAYQRVQEAKAKSRARSGGARAITSPPPPPPPPKNTGTPSQPIVVIDGAIVDPPVPEVISESDLKTRGQRIIESPPRPKEAPSSSSVPPTGPDGAPPEPSGGDSSTPLKK
ncbi:formin-like protein 16 [Arachis stenosperma]|uniref:formin-like protein 16 n=1 Tax=Arachis stenosperma TaxID=217475 RepID=UPI0025ABC8AD|nr:formin-like protein 16 [Arachis stenosperma]